MATSMQFELVCPDRLVVSEAVDMAVVPGSDGDFGAMAAHAPLLSTVRPGIVALYTNGKVVRRLFVSGGFAEVTGERCTVLSEEAIDLSLVTRADVVSRLQSADDRLKEAVDSAEKARAEQDKTVADALQAAFETVSSQAAGAHAS